MGRDAEYWAKGGTSLKVGEVPQDAINLNVEGRLVMGPIQGFGKMWQRTYRTNLRSVEPRELIKVWKERFPEFWPEGNKFFGALTGIAPGDVALLNLTMPGRVKLSTGVLVLYADEESFTLMTPEGHFFAGWITFSAAPADGGTLVQVQVLMRAQDPIYEVALAFGGKKMEDKFWTHTLKSLAANFGEDVEVDITTICVDKKRQWRRWKNIFKNAGVRSGFYMLGTPFRRKPKTKVTSR